MIRLFASDLDGTLLNENHKVDERIAGGIEKILHSGVNMAVATGRNYERAKFKEFEGFYYITLNGAHILDPNGQTISTSKIDSSIIKDILIHLSDLPLRFSDERHLYFTIPKEKHYEELRAGSERFKPMSEEDILAFTSGNVYDQTAEDILAHDILKIGCSGMSEEQRERLNAYLDEHQHLLTNAPSYADMFEITKKGVNKGSAVAMLAKKLNIQEDEVAVYGDGGNDIEMLHHFKNSYAPSDGSQAAMNAAHEIIDSCHNYGVITHMLQTIQESK